MAWCIVVPLFRCRGKKDLREGGKETKGKETGAGFIEQVGILLKKALEINAASNQNKVNSEKLSKKGKLKRPDNKKFLCLYEAGTWLAKTALHFSYRYKKE